MYSPILLEEVFVLLDELVWTTCCLSLFRGTTWTATVKQNQTVWNSLKKQSKPTKRFIYSASSSCYGIPNKFEASIRWLPFIAFTIPFFALFRLAKFNLDESQSVNFIGFPTPLVAILLCFFPLYFFLQTKKNEKQENAALHLEV